MPHCCIDTRHHLSITCNRSWTKLFFCIICKPTFGKISKPNVAVQDLSGFALFLKQNDLPCKLSLNLAGGHARFRLPCGCAANLLTSKVIPTRDGNAVAVTAFLGCCHLSPFSFPAKYNRQLGKFYPCFTWEPPTYFIIYILRNVVG